MTQNKNEELTLISRAAAGDSDAFGDLYELHMDTIYKYIFYRTQNVQDAEDLTETAFLKAWQALPAYKPTGAPFRAWLIRIASNLVIDHYRTSKSVETIDNHTNMMDAQPTVEQNVSQREQIGRLMQVLKRLAPDYQSVLVMRFINGLTHAETAEALGRSAGSIRVLQHRALKELQALMAIEEVA